MSCSVCAGYSSYNCPCCGKDTRIIECPDCENGLRYYSIDIKTGEEKQVTKAAYLILPFDEDDARQEKKRYYQGDIVKCRTCDGDGVIAEE